MHSTKVKLIKKKCIENNFNISFAESCTGGLLSSLFTRIPGSSQFFEGAYIVYSNKLKVKALNVPAKIIKKYGAVSNECCKVMVQSLYKISQSKICVSITGIAGPGGGSKKKPIGLVYIGIKKGKLLIIKENKFKSKKRSTIQNLAANKVIKILKDLI